MAKRPSLGTIASGFFSRQSLNDNFNEILSAFDNTISRDGSTPNAMAADLDLNSNDVLNVGSLQSQTLKVGGVNITPTTTFSDANFLRTYDTVADLEGSNVPAAINNIRTAGYHSSNDGGSAMYTRADSEPSHAGKIQSNDGAWWELVAVNGFADVRQFGAKGDGTTDDSTAVTNALNYSSSEGVTVFAFPGTYLLSSAVTVPAFARLFGHGEKTVFAVSSGATYHAFTAANVDGIYFCGFKIEGGGLSAGLHNGIELDTCDHCRVIDLWIDDVDAIPVHPIDCDVLVIDRLYVTYPSARTSADTGGYAVYAEGCSNTVISNSHGYGCHFAFTIVAAEYSGYNGVRDIDDTIGVIVSSCTADNFTGVGFDSNGVYGVTFIGCTTRNFVGSVNNAAFQNKHASNDNARVNKFIGCHVQDGGRGFYCQDGSRVLLEGFTARKVQEDAIFINNSPNTRVANAVIEDWGLDGNIRYGVVIRNSPSTHVTGISMSNDGTSGGSSASQIQFEGSANCVLDDTEANGSFWNGLVITTSNNIVLGPLVRITDSICANVSLSDGGTATVYPYEYTIVLDVTVSGAKGYGNNPRRGLIVGRVVCTTMENVTGSPTIDIVTSGGTTLVSGGAPGASMNDVQDFTLANDTVPVAETLRASVTATGTAGEVGITVQGLQIV